MKFKTFFTYLTALFVAVFMNAAMAKKSDKSDKSEKSLKSDKQSERRTNGESRGRGHAYGHCQSKRGGHGRGRGRGRDRNCDEPENEPEAAPVIVSVCETDVFPEGQVFDLAFSDPNFQIDTATEEDDVGNLATVITGVGFTGSYCSAEDPLPPFEILVEDEKGQMFCAEENPPQVNEADSTVTAFYLCAVEQA